MSTEHQPGSPGVDLGELESEGHEWDHGQLLRAARSLGAELRTLRARVAELEMPDTEADRILTMSDEELDAEIRAVGIDPAELDKRASHVAKWAAECSKLRARVGELEAAAKTPNTTEVWGYDSDGVEMTPPDYACEGKCGRELRVHGGMCAGCLEGARLINRLALKRESERAESAEARVAALEKLFDDAGQGNYNVLALIDHYQSEAMAESERRREAEARVKELEAWVRDLESDARADAEVLLKRDDRITSLESQLAAAREEQGLEARVRKALSDRFPHVRIMRWQSDWSVEWRRDKLGDWPPHFANAETIPALLRAILEVEAK